MKYFNELVTYLNNQGLEQPVGCTSKEISEIESGIGNPLPAAYKEYLSILGKDYDGVMVGTNCFASDIELNNECVQELLHENNLSDFIKKEKHITFFCHQGYMVAWFTVPNDRDDPIVTHYFEGTHDKPEVFGKFSDFMNKDLMGNARLRVALRGHQKTSKKWWAFWK